MSKLYRGTIRKTPAGTYGVWYYVDDPATGKRKQKAKKGFRTWKAADAFLTTVKAAQLTGTYTDLQKIGFKSLAEKFLTEYAPLHLGETTIRSYQSFITMLVGYFGERPATAIHPGDLQRFVATMAARTSRRNRTYAPKTVNNALVLAHRIFALGKKWGYLRENPAADIEHLKVTKQEMAFHTRDEVGKLLQTATGDAKAVLALGFLCGLRRGEVAGLRWADVDFDKGQLQVRTSLVMRTKKEAAKHHGQRWLLKEPKSRAGRRTVDMVSTVRDALELLRLGAPPAKTNPLGLVFTKPGPDGPEPWDPGHLVNKNYVAVCKAAKVRVLRFHDLRHTHTALRLASGMTDIKYLQRQLGHSSIQMTLDTYGHLFQETNAKETDRLQREVETILTEAAVPDGNAS